MTNNNDLTFKPERMNNITATDMPALFALNPYESPASIISRKLDPKPIYSPAIRRGHLFEPAALEAFKLDMGIDTIRNNNVTYVLKNHQIAATPDAFVAGSKQKIVVEVKSTGSSRFVKWYLEPPLYYQLQVHTQMLVCNSDKGYLGALEAGDPSECTYRFIAWEITRNNQIEDLMKEETKRFWECLKNKDSDDAIKYRANSAIKKEMISLLSTSRKLLYPESPLDFLEMDMSEEAEKVRTILYERYET